MLPISDDFPFTIDDTKVFSIPRRGDRDRSVQFNIRLVPTGPNKGANVMEASRSWIIDGETGEVRDAYIHDAFRLHTRSAENPDGLYPPFDQWKLGPLPPKKPTAP